jgi:hypothetical protein
VVLANAYAIPAHFMATFERAHATPPPMRIGRVHAADVGMIQDRCRPGFRLVLLALVILVSVGAEHNLDPLELPLAHHDDAIGRELGPDR